MSVWLHVCACAYRGQKLMPNVFFCHFSPHVLRHDFSCDLELAKLSSIARQVALGTCCLCSWNSGLTGKLPNPPRTQHGCWVFESWSCEFYHLAVSPPQSVYIYLLFFPLKSVLSSKFQFLKYFYIYHSF